MASSNFWGDLIRDLREEHDMSQRELCRVSGVNRSTLRNVEEGTCTSIKRVETLLAVFGYELDAIRRTDVEAT